MREAVTAGAISRVLREKQRGIIARALKVLGQERCVEILIDALNMESNGGMLLKDRSRRRTLGGTFLQLCKERSTPEERRAIFR